MPFCKLHQATVETFINITIIPHRTFGCNADMLSHSLYVIKHISNKHEFKKTHDFRLTCHTFSYTSNCQSGPSLMTPPPDW